MAMRLLRALALCLCAFIGMALPASAVEVMVVGNASPEAGLTTAAAAKKLKDLMTKIYGYESVNPIVYAANLSKAELDPRLKAFESKLENSDFAIFYYLADRRSRSVRGQLPRALWLERQQERTRAA